jgi:uncharacterized membrane protein YfcA
MLGGLIGLGGAEFRLPVLAGPLGYAARRAVPLNLAISITTIIAALLIQSGSLSLSSITPFLPSMLALFVGAVVSAFFGASLSNELTNEQLERIILLLLLGIGIALVVEAFLPQTVPGLLPATQVWRLIAGVVLGLGIGLVSSLLGVAGGELIIPTMVFAFGADIKTAGTTSLIISLPMTLIGVVRYAQQGAFVKHHDLVEIVAPMAGGSVIGAIIGGLLVGVVPAAALKGVLGVILIVSALRIFRHAR